jgi:hypothetical protein
MSTHAQLSGAPIEVIHAPERDEVYVLCQRKDETGAAIMIYALVAVSYMPSVDAARGWVATDRVPKESRHE